MLVSPVNWYFAVPGVTTTGPFNQHFLRDIGIIFLFLGAAFLIGAPRPRISRRRCGAPRRSGSAATRSSILGSRGRHLRSVRARPRLSGRHAASAHRRAADLLGHSRPPRRPDPTNPRSKGEQHDPPHEHLPGRPRRREGDDGRRGDASRRAASSTACSSWCGCVPRRSTAAATASTCTSRTR